MVARQGRQRLDLAANGEQENPVVGPQFTEQALGGRGRRGQPRLREAEAAVERHRERQRDVALREHRDLLGPAVLFDHEVVGAQAGNRFAPLVRHRRIHLDDADTGGKLRP